MSAGAEQQQRDGAHQASTDATAQGTLLAFYVETPLRVGPGQPGMLDEPLQRERVSSFPFIPATALKGALRGEALARGLGRERIAGLFGAPQREPHGRTKAGALSVTDAKLALFPVRSASGVFAWVTSPMVLARLRRDVALIGGSEVALPLTDGLDASAAFVSQDSSLVVDGSLVLEEFCFKARGSAEVAALAEWLAKHLLPREDVFDFWRAKLCSSLAVVHDDVFRDFVSYTTEVGARLAVDRDSQAAVEAVQYEECLPADCLLYSVLIAESVQLAERNVTARESLEELSRLEIQLVQLGAGKSLGRGLCRVRMVDAQALGE